MTNPKFPPPDLFGEILASFLDDTGIFRSRILWAEHIGMSPASITRWVTNIPANLMPPRYFASIFNCVEARNPTCDALQLFWAHAYDNPEGVAPNRKLDMPLFDYLVIGEQKDFMARLVERLAHEDPDKQLELLRHWRTECNILGPLHAEDASLQHTEAPEGCPRMPHPH